MKFFRFYLRLLATLLVRYKILVMLGFFLGVFFVFLLPRIIIFLPKTIPTQKIGLVGHYRPTELPLSIQSLVSFGLTETDQNGLPKAKASTSWKIEDDGKTYTFFLNANLEWHDKSKLKASDINYNFSDVEMEVVNEQTIRIKLKEPFSPLLEAVSRPLFKKGFIGLGDYKVKKITKKGDFVEGVFLDSLVKGKPDIQYFFYPTEESAKTAMKLGEINKLEGIVNPGSLKDWPNLSIKPVLSYDRYVGLFFNLNKPSLGEKNIRQALAYALEKNYGSARAIGPLNPNSWAYSDEVKPYDYDLEKAKKQINKKFTLKLLTVSSLLNEAERIKNSWEKLGLKVEIGPFNDLGDDFDVLLAIQEIPPDPDQYVLWHSMQAGNITQLKNARIDKLLEDGRKTIDLEQRKKIYYDFQRYLVEEVPVIFLYYPTTYDIERK